MVLQGDSAAREFPEIRAVEFVCPVPFAPGDQPLPFGAVHIDLCGYDFVESESHLPRLLQDADPIPAACRIGARGFGCVYQVVHRPGQMRGVETVGACPVVQHLHFYAGTRRPAVLRTFLHSEEDTAVAAFADFPLQPQVEIFEFRIRDQIAAPLFAGREPEPQLPVADRPAFGSFVPVEGVPSGGRDTVEKEYPAFGLFFGRQRIGLFGRLQRFWRHRFRGRCGFCGFGRACGRQAEDQGACGEQGVFQGFHMFGCSEVM